MAPSLKILWLVATLFPLCACLPLPHAAHSHLPWQPHQFTTGPIVVPGVTFPSGFPFPVRYPLPLSFPYTPIAYQNVLPSLIAQFNAALAAHSNNIAAATTAFLAAFDPNYSNGLLMHLGVKGYSTT